MKRYIFNTLTVVSVLLLLATVGLWGRSHIYFDEIWFAPGNSYCIAHSMNGRASVVWELGRSTPVTLRQRYKQEKLSGSSLANHDMASGLQLEFLGFAWNQFVFRDAPDNVTNRHLVVPHWFPAFVFAILPAIWLFKWNKRRKLGPNACPSCGYDLTGNESGVCPECGVGAGT